MCDRIQREAGSTGRRALVSVFKLHGAEQVFESGPVVTENCDDLRHACRKIITATCDEFDQGAVTSRSVGGMESTKGARFTRQSTWHIFQTPRENRYRTGTD